jgi:hypothetical protein
VKEAKLDEKRWVVVFDAEKADVHDQRMNRYIKYIGPEAEREQAIKTMSARTKVSEGKKLADMNIGDYVSWKSHEGIQKAGSGRIIDVWQNKDGHWTATAKNSFTTVALLDSDLSESKEENYCANCGRMLPTGTSYCSKCDYVTNDQFTGRATTTEEDELQEAIKPEAIEKIKGWIKKDGLRPAAIKLVDWCLYRKCGMTSGSMPDTSEFANGVDEVEDQLKNQDFQGALDAAKETANDMIQAAKDEMGES